MLRSSTRSRACLALCILVSGSCTHRCIAQEFLGSCSLAVTLIISKEVRVLPLLFLQHGFCQLIYCAVSVGIWCALLVLDLCSSTSSCALSVLVIVSRTVDWWTNRGTTTFQRPELSWTVRFGVSALSLCVGCSGAAPLFLPCGFAAWCLRHIQFGQNFTRTPLYETPVGTVIRFPRPRSLSQ